MRKLYLKGIAFLSSPIKNQNKMICPIMYKYLTKEYKWFEDSTSTLRPQCTATCSQLVELYFPLFSNYRSGQDFMNNEI